MSSIIKYLLVPAVSFIVAFVLYNWLFADTAWLRQKNQPVAAIVEPKGEAIVNQQDEVSIGSSFNLINQYGKEVSDKDFRGRLMLVYFGFTRCPNICPTDLATISSAMAMLNDKVDEVQPIFITIDPEYDTPEVMKDYMMNFFPGIQALTGPEQEVKKVAEAYKIYQKKVFDESGQDYTMEHSGYAYLMDRDGKFLTHFSHGQAPEEIAEKIKEIL